MIALPFQQHQFGRAAANIKNHGRPVAFFKQRLAAEHRQARFLSRGDDVEHDAGFRFHPRDELFSIFRLTTGFGRDRARQHDTPLTQLVRTDHERRNRPVDRGVGKATGRREPLAEAHDARKSVNDDETIALRTGDEQSTIVGAQIKRRKIAARTDATRRHFFPAYSAAARPIRIGP